MIRADWPPVYRYGFSVLLFTALITIALLLRYSHIDINLTIPVVIGLIAATWWGGRGPGLVFVFLVIAATAVLAPSLRELSVISVLLSLLSVSVVLVLIVILISSRRLSERRLREQTDFLTIALSSIGDAIVATDDRGGIDFVNQAAARLLSCTEEEIKGQRLDEVFSVIDETTGEAVPCIFEAVQRSGRQVSLSDSHSITGKDGVAIPVSYTASPLFDRAGQFRGSVIAFQDLRARRQAEKAMIEAHARNQQSQKLEAIGTLSGGIAHDFNNILTAILGFAQMSMFQLSSTHPAFENLARIEQAATKGGELTGKLLAFSRRQHLDRRVIDLNRTVSEILKLLERLIGENITVAFIPETHLAPALADPAQIEQIIMNLCINARDAMPNGGRLTIETHNVDVDENYARQFPNFEPGRYTQILVSDTGIGMDDEIKSHIFEPFFTTKEIDKGTGLGLAMVYGIVKQHEGQINVYSEVGQGSTFKVFLPVVESEVTETPKVTQPKLIGGRETILVAEDEEPLRILSKEVLNSLGYTVLTAKNGKEAVEIFELDPSAIDLLLFDVAMPVMGGAEAYLHIRDTGGEKTPVIFMTGYSTEMLDGSRSSEVEFNLGGTRVLQKPYTLDALGRMVRDTLDDVG